VVYVNAVDPSGRRFYGKGQGRGMCLNIRVAKSAGHAETWAPARVAP
jgi:hypothetical protein